MNRRKFKPNADHGLRCPVCSQYWGEVSELGNRVYGVCKQDGMARSVGSGSADADAMLAIYAAREEQRQS